jgi:predicted DNA-binding ribbon-helix-helix protein
MIDIEHTLSVSDGKVDVVLDLEHDLLYELMLMAHERDITLNQLIETILKEYIKNEQSN